MIKGDKIIVKKAEKKKAVIKMNSANTLYNIFTELCSLIIRSCHDELIFVRCTCISEDLKYRIKQDMSEHSGLKFDVHENAAGSSRLAVRCLTADDLNETLYSTLREYISQLDERSDIYGMIGLAQSLDEAMRVILLEELHKFQEDSFSVVLNSNRESTGIGLLPRCSCIWERRHRLSHSYNRLDNFLCNILLIENRIIDDLIDKHIFLKNDMFPELAARRSIRIAASPLRREPHFTLDCYTRENIRYSSVTYDRTTFMKDNEAVWDKLVKASEHGCDIMVFPELLGNPDTEAYISNKLRLLSEEEQRQMPSLIVLPSVLYGQVNNVTLLNSTGEVICRQSKQNPHRLEKEGSYYLEDIRKSHVVSILHYEGLGRIAVLICRDFISTRYMEQLMRCFKLTLIIVPSYSTGSYDFRQSFDLCAHDDCNVIWINTCAAFTEGKEDNFRHIGYVRKRIGRNDDESQRLCEMPVCREAFTGQCAHDCLFFETIQGV